MVLEGIACAEGLTNAERRIADYVLVHAGDVPAMDITALAEAVPCASATIVRFCQKLGTGGHRQEGDARVEEGLRILRRRAAWNLCNLQVVTDPEVFAIAGGISNEPRFISYLREAVDELADVIPQHFERPELVPCEFKASANLVGAAYAWELAREAR